ncbi:MAG: inositol monophosphatase family protein [Spirulinaceae cyanobacterium]
MNSYWLDVLEFSTNLTKEIGDRLLQDFGKIQATKKDDGSLVTEADRWSDKVIRDAIAQKFPDHGILTEETLHTLPDTDWCWIVDPIDGTTNFTRGVPIWGISMGLLYRGTPVFGVVYLPPIQQFFHGYWYGDSDLDGPTGAYMNDVKIQTSPDNPSHSHLFNLCARSMDVAKQTDFPCKIRSIGVASYNCLLVALGAALGGVEATPKIWDIAAVWVIVQAAGGVFVALEPDPVFPLKTGEDYGKRSFPSLVVSQPDLVPVFRPFVQFIGDRVCKQRQ